MKATGAILVIAAFTAFGITKSKSLSGRAKCLGAIIDALRYICSELQSAATPMPEIFAELYRLSRPETRKLFLQLDENMDSLSDLSFGELWQSALQDKSLNLSDYQRDELCRLGLYLGRYPAAEQCSAIEACILHLESEHEAAIGKAREGRKLYTGLGLTAGLMFATVLF